MDNFNDNDKHIVDTDFIEVDIEEKLENMNINKEPLYYTRVQTAKILGENESTISYWSKQFQPLLNLKIINMTRKYTKIDIENLMFIQKLLRQDHLTIQQALEYCSEKGFNSESGLVDSSNPLAVQTFISAMTVEFDKKVSEMQNTIIQQQREMIENLQSIILQNNEELKQEICLTVDEVVTEKINDFEKNLIEDQSQQIQNNFNNMSNKIINENTKMMNEFKCIKLEEIQKQEEPKGFFSKIFNFKN